MLQALKRMWSGAGRPANVAEAAVGSPPAVLGLPGRPPLPFADVLSEAEGLPRVDWARVAEWAGDGSGGLDAAAWEAATLAWLAHLGAALGEGYRVRRLDDAVLLSREADAEANAKLAFVSRTARRIRHHLDGIADPAARDLHVLIAFDAIEDYDRYVAPHYPDDGEFGATSGMHIQDGRPHDAVPAADMWAIEPVIAHEMTHGSLAHLPIPAWLNEGLAVNVERQISPRPGVGGDDLRARHAAFWTDAAIQEFWSGMAFLRPDEGQELSYDFARILVAQFARDRAAFAAFVNAADLGDAGAGAAASHLHLDLGAAASALCTGAPIPAWRPDPRRWPQPPERGAF